MPDQLAVVGVDDDHLLCELSEVPLSSVAQPTYAIGYEASRTLHEMMTTPGRPVSNLWLPALHVARRASSDLVAIEDEDVAKRQQLIRDHATEPIGVDWLVKQMPVSRRSLGTKRFARRSGGRSWNTSTTCACKRRDNCWLRPTWGSKTIATMSGFQTTRWLSKNFNGAHWCLARGFSTDRCVGGCDERV